MTSLLPIGVAIGLFAATVVVAYRIRRPIVDRRYWTEAENRFADQAAGYEIPRWVNNGPPPFDLPLPDLVEELHFMRWETELEDHT